MATKKVTITLADLAKAMCVKAEPCGPHQESAEKVFARLTREKPRSE